MVGIYKYENGLFFTGVIASSKEKAENYLAEKYGSFERVLSVKRDENGYPIYESELVPQYNKSAFVIKELKQI